MDDFQGEFDFEKEEEHGAARWSDPDTSHDAAESVEPSHLYSLILATLAKAGSGLITHEISHATGIGIQTISQRMRPMANKGWIYDTGEKRVWMGAPGHPATNRQSIVWQLTALMPQQKAS